MNFKVIEPDKIKRFANMETGDVFHRELPCSKICMLTETGKAVILAGHVAGSYVNFDDNARVIYLGRLELGKE